MDNTTADPKPNEGYKASVFSLIFENPPSLRELYCAITGEFVPSDAPITINTLRDALFKARVNDISFTIGDKLVILIEHQSTINPNMALRLLLYIARLYEKLIDNKTLYKRTAVKIPRPEFIVLYNGTEPYPDQKILTLSELYEADERGKGVNLELEVKLFNINTGHNAEMLGKCPALEGYSQFVAKEREFEADGDERRDAITRAVKYCVKHDILKDFLMEHGSEVTNMLLDEWNWDTALEVSFEEGVEVGEQRGIQQGKREGQDAVLSLLRRGYTLDQIERTLETRNSPDGKPYG
jgi:hypothetical protein